MLSDCVSLTMALSHFGVQNVSHRSNNLFRLFGLFATDLCLNPGLDLVLSKTVFRYTKSGHLVVFFFRALARFFLPKICQYRQ
jgi:hypothetical protein